MFLKIIDYKSCKYNLLLCLFLFIWLCLFSTKKVFSLFKIALKVKYSTTKRQSNV